MSSFAIRRVGNVQRLKLFSDSDVNKNEYQAEAATECAEKYRTLSPNEK
jgi:hypothetical protein